MAGDVAQDSERGGKPKLNWQPYRPVTSPQDPAKSAVVLATSVEPIQPDEPSRAPATSAAASAARASAAARSRSPRSPRAKTRDEVLGLGSSNADAFADPFEDRQVPARGVALQRAPKNQPAEEPTEDLTMPKEPTPEEGPSGAEPAFKSRQTFPEEALPAPTTELGPDESYAGPSGDPCADAQKACQENMESLRTAILSKIPLDVGVSGQEGRDFPCTCRLGNTVFEPRHWSETCFTWKAAGTCHKPLYFEEVALERYGHAFNPLVQPFVSGAHFFSSIAFLPYKMGIDPPNECIYTLGYYRPGNCAPYIIDPIPWSVRGAVYEGVAVATAGFVFFR